MKIFYYCLGPGLAILAIVATLLGDHRLKTSVENINTSMKNINTSMKNINTSVDEQIGFLIRVNARLDLTEVTTALWMDDRAEPYLTMLSGNHAYGCAGRYVDYSPPPDRKFMVTEEGNILIAELDNKLKSRLFDKQKEHPDWSPAKIIREENLAALQILILNYNEINKPLPHLDLQTLVGIMNACIIGG